MSAIQTERLLAGFEPSFEFEPVAPIAPAEFDERVRRLRRVAAERECGAVLVHADAIGWYHTSNSFLRYFCDWIREGVLVVPTDRDREATLLTFFAADVLLPPPGEPTWVDDIRQVGPWSRQTWDRPGSTVASLATATAAVLAELGVEREAVGTIGDGRSVALWEALPEAGAAVPQVDLTPVAMGMQRVRSEAEIEQVRAAARLLEIGVEAAQHVAAIGVSDHEIYAAFTFAQMARGGESGDGYQIGINPWGTHVSKPYGHRVEAGDLIQLYLSHVTYRGYDAQAARMILAGEPSPFQRELIEMCIEGVERATAKVRPGVLVRELNAAAFAGFVERGFLTSSEAREMPWNWAPLEDGSPRPFPREAVPAPGWEAQGRDLRHVYPATAGPNGPRLGHGISMSALDVFSVISSNEDRLEPGMTFVLHAQWYEPGKGGCNLGNSMVVTEDGVEVLTDRTPMTPARID